MLSDFLHTDIFLLTITLRNIVGLEFEVVIFGY